MARSKKHLGKYVDPRTDFGMKFYFGREENKILLIEFLNSLFEGEKIIVDLKYKTVEHDGDQEHMRRVVFDLHCIGNDGEIFIVEFQQLFQEFFKDRAVFYTSRLINKQLARGKKGNDYHLPEVYFVGILEFDVNSGSGLSFSRDTKRPYFYDVALCDKHTHEVFYDKLGYKIVSLPVFNKQPEELETVMDQWLYLLKHLSTMDKLPSFLDKRIFGRIFAIGEIGKLKEEDLMSYEASLKQRRDAESVYNSAMRAGEARGEARGKAEGRQEERAKADAEKRESAVKMLKNGFEVKMISEILGLTIEEVEKLK
ncbi:Rpn family recombination-promoting nuclease/putative transposase [Sphingobacterium sp. UT-1RO-CII-1]|uniref:Rpn family recombination-promoting nuclease/putative transposase n=1 Tax=Sphingobacterium sp. UT-1RO-CII-1 TaxID=2995225 RepID=UPI00227C4180|nr:Rpn family recombination-promoting nuclease/putative transposase [Sphingobacterium sp. UT-1RO-CII-1]MCY4780791.1 Rpn family recombination-promoting nuclease/putative transposase [Sphingobacterium sp. UT-1RO-CII-1]